MRQICKRAFFHLYNISKIRNLTLMLKNLITAKGFLTVMFTILWKRGSLNQQQLSSLTERGASVLLRKG